MIVVFDRNFKIKTLFGHFANVLVYTSYFRQQMGRGSSVGRATRYGLDGPGIQPR